jgi:hypothetical protein
LRIKIKIDQEEFIKLYNEDVSYRKLARHFHCSIMKIQLTRIEFKLPARGLKIMESNVDEKRFRELYDNGYSYQSIGKILQISNATVAKYVKLYDLVERDAIIMRIDVEKFKQDYLGGTSICRLRFCQNL